ncbi:MAG: sulfatase-like hydrolase/transferase, partial [Thermoanaerobaculia bacterium]|nr:sulfatase-like hydrolase/transferase [Thermoanaerobaculia bacterium]
MFAGILAIAAACRDSELLRPIDARSDPPNVILVSIDALGASHVGSYGNRRDVTPFLDGLAEEGTRFANAFVNTHGTTPSHTTMLSGTYQETHRVMYDVEMKVGEQMIVPIPGEIPFL